MPITLYQSIRSITGPYYTSLICAYAIYAVAILALMLIPNNANAQVDLTKKIPNMPISNTMINFTQATELQNWVVVNDTVMGGRSRTQIERIELGEKAQAHMLMYGELSLENNGGFASIRRIYSPMDWHSGRTFSLTVIGDGREYQFRLRTNKTWDGVAYVTNFKTVKGEQQTFTFSTNDFTPRFRGRFVRDAGKINFKDITQIGIMLSDGSPGEFSLMVKEIKQLTTSV